MAALTLASAIRTSGSRAILVGFLVGAPIVFELFASRRRAKPSDFRKIL
jgi:hypothetical protein